MGVYIKGMEMPKNCYQCRMVDSCQYLWKPYDLDDYSDLQNMVEEGFTRADNCPLVAVPPHGRLIDADALSSKLTDLAENEWNQRTGTTWAEAFEEVDGFIQDAPTIIPVDLVEDGE